MKKILGISLVALFAAMPMMAKASNVNTVNATGNALTTQSYVKGAFNVLAEGINTKQDQIKAGEADVATSIVLSSTVHEATAEGINSAADNAMISEKAALKAIQSAVSAADGAMDSRVDDLELKVGDSSAGLVKEVADLQSLTSNYATVTSNAAAGAAASATIATYGDIVTHSAAEFASSTAFNDLANAVNDTSTGLATKASAADLGALTTRVTNVESSIGSAAYTGDSITGAIAALQSTSAALNSTYQTKEDSKVATGTYAHITEGNGVGANLVSLNSAVVANDSSISTINSRQIPIVNSWSSDAVSYTRIDALSTNAE